MSGANRRIRRVKSQAFPPDKEGEIEAIESAVQFMIGDVLSHMDHTRPLGSLNRKDLARLAEAALVGWVLKRAEQAARGDREAADDIMGVD